jgi:hypothetical protein
MAAVRWAKRKRRRVAGRREKPSLIANIVFEVLALSAFLILLFSVKSDCTGRPSDNRIADGAAAYGTLITGFISDQIQRHNPTLSQR